MPPRPGVRPREARHHRRPRLHWLAIDPLDLVERAIDEIVLIDNLSTQRLASLFDLRSDFPTRFIDGDIRSLDLSTVIEPGDVVIHLAALTGVDASLGDPKLVEDVNVIGTVRVAQACAARGARLLFLSSTSVYSSLDGAADEASISRRRRHSIATRSASGTPSSALPPWRPRPPCAMPWRVAAPSTVPRRA